jgi:hypothetical protein
MILKWQKPNSPGAREYARMIEMFTVDKLEKRYAVLVETTNREAFIAMMNSKRRSTPGHEIHLFRADSWERLHKTDWYEDIEEAEKVMLRWLYKEYGEFGQVELTNEQLEAVITRE